MKYRDKVREISEDKEFNKWFRQYVKVKPPKTKLAIYIDRNVPLDVVNELRRLSNIVRIERIADSRDEVSYKYHDAAYRKALLITSDQDFWDDSKLRVLKSSGVIVVRGKATDEAVRALAFFFTAVGLVDAVGRFPDWMGRQKFKVSHTGYVRKALTYESKVEVEEIQY